LGRGLRRGVESRRRTFLAEQHAPVIPARAREEGDLPLGQPQLAELLDAPVLEHEFEPGAIAVLAIAVAIEDAQEGLDAGEEQFFRREVFEQPRAQRDRS
jgi:hypothetical protein